MRSPFRDVSYDEMVEALEKLAAEAPEYVRLFSGNDAFSVAPATGTCGVRHPRCDTWVVALTHWASLPGGAAAEKEGVVSKRAEVYVSGALHGDERVGPLATLSTLRLLALGARCHDDGGGEECDVVTPEVARWLHGLARRRILYATPATNALGYARRSRMENSLDPNRDFPIDTRSDSCLRSATARVVDALFRRHVFQVVVTFHGGMRAVAYEWGAPTYGRRRHQSLASPDEASQKETSEYLARAAGGFGRVPKYAVDRMNSIVYPVHGGMEDWAYAGSWDRDLEVNCRGIRSNYPNASLRAFAVLVETSDDKAGPPRDLGHEESVFSNKADGHVSRNVRLALAALEVVEPYVEWLGNGNKWAVGGAVAVDETYVRANCDGVVVDVLGERLFDDVSSWGLPGLASFVYGASLSRFSECGRLELVARARVDSRWAVAPRDARPRDTKPQTHLANVRTNPEWRMENNGRVVRGSLWWHSSPVVHRKKSHRRRSLLLFQGAVVSRDTIIIQPLYFFFFFFFLTSSSLSVIIGGGSLVRRCLRCATDDNKKKKKKKKMIILV